MGFSIVYKFIADRTRLSLDMLFYDFSYCLYFLIWKITYIIYIYVCCRVHFSPPYLSVLEKRALLCVGIKKGSCESYLGSACCIKRKEESQVCDEEEGSWQSVIAVRIEWHRGPEISYNKIHSLHPWYHNGEPHYIGTSQLAARSFQDEEKKNSSSDSTIAEISACYIWRVLRLIFLLL